MISLPSLQSLYIEMFNDGSRCASGTGFVMLSSSGAPYLITNRHNVTGRNNMTGDMLHPYSPPDTIQIHHLLNRKNDQQGLTLINRGIEWRPFTENLYDTNGNHLWHEHPTLGGLADFVAVRLTNVTDLDFNPYIIEQHDVALVPSTSVNIIGFPFGESGGGRLAIWTRGFIASEITANYNGHPQFLIDSRTRQGQSGSPVVYVSNGFTRRQSGGVSMSSRSIEMLLGIYCGRINAESDIGIVWKASAIQELIDTLT